MGVKPAEIRVDLHGCNQFQARIRLNAALKDTGGVYRVRVIHGFNSGNALRDMVRNEYASHPKVIRTDEREPGATVLILRE